MKPYGGSMNKNKQFLTNIQQKNLKKIEFVDQTPDFCVFHDFEPIFTPDPMLILPYFFMTFFKLVYGLPVC